MKRLIDGYNLMHATVAMTGKLGPDALRKLRHRFLNELAHRLGPFDAAGTVVVFDARNPPDHLPREASHKGMRVIFAASDDDADSRIETLIAAHSSPKGLTVVSSDRRVRQAALRRKARALSADEFWSSLEARKKPAVAPEAPPRTVDPPPLSAEESAYWQEAFRDVAESPEGREFGRRADWVPTDDEIAKIAREVEQEEPNSGKRRPGRPKPR